MAHTHTEKERASSQYIYAFKVEKQVLTVLTMPNQGRPLLYPLPFSPQLLALSLCVCVCVYTYIHGKEEEKFSQQY